MLAPGSTVAGYRIDRLLGQGGMGAVYEATQLSLNRTVALKLISAELGDDEDFRERFRREGHVHAAMSHPHIVPVFEAGESEHGLFLAMQLIRGPNLRSLIVGRELTPGAAVRLLGQVADALDTAHAAGLIHRDVKPENILVSGDGRHAFLTDFGVTKTLDGRTALTRTGRLVGTLDYISPEQIRGEPAEPASDVYALGAVLYESLTGSIPFPRDSDAAVLYAHLSDLPPAVTERRPDLPPGFDHVVTRALAKEPAARYRSAGELMDSAAEAAAAAGTALDVPAGPLSAPAEAGIRAASPDVTPSRRWLVLAGVGVAAALLAVAGYAVGETGSGSDPETADRRITAANISLPYVRPWRSRDVATGTPLEQAAAIELTEGARRTTLTAGSARPVRPSFLPGSLARRAALEKRRIVRVGNAQAYRYRIGSTTAYALPGAADSTVVLCDGAPGLLPKCEAVLHEASVERPVTLQPRAVDARALRRLATSLEQSRGRGLDAMRRAANSAEQASAAGQVANAYRTAAGNLRPAKLAALARPELRALDMSLADAAQAYDRLAAAAEAGAASRYASRRKDVRDAERSVAVRFRALSPYGLTTAG